MRRKILLIIALALLGLLTVVAVAAWNLRGIAVSIRHEQETTNAVYHQSIAANRELRAAMASVQAQFEAKTRTDLDLAGEALGRDLEALGRSVAALRGPAFAEVLARSLADGGAAAPGDPEAAATRTLGSVVEAVEARLPEIAEAARQVQELAGERLALTGQLAQVKDDLSKALRRCLDLHAVDAKAYGNLVRGAITVLSTDSGRDVKFAGKAKFDDGAAALEKASLSEAQRAGLAALKAQFATTYEVVRHYLATDADAGFFRSKAREQSDDLQLLESSLDRANADSQTALVERSQRTIWTTVILATIIACLSVASGLVVARSITARMTATLADVAAVAEALAAGDLTRRVPTGVEDELGAMGAAMNRTLDLMRDAMRHLAAATGRLSESAAGLARVSAVLDGSAATASGKALEASAAAQQVSSNVQSVSAGIEEMSVSVGEVAGNSGKAAATCNEAVGKAADARATIAKLAVSSKEIGDIVTVIGQVAGQTNLLALNATIEAARAGEAGRGFAVVASEVKALALKTTAATADIRRRIEAIRADSELTTTAVGQIDATIQQVNDLQQSIASAVEEQAATSREIARRLAETALGSRDIVAGAGQVAEATRATLAAAGETRALADSLTAHAGEIDAIVRRFSC